MLATIVKFDLELKL
ncbi:a5ab58e6-0111-4e00-84d0-40ac9e7f946a [Thermothielavioides terrestris]|uniref:A5ab58e6-0111-4e00-84d0-40ac9e7f946a n=1 Tax=Thermothielavioides terrestris TaxID=2587410 RepID=A0A3S4D1H3_9PEZI|nr:a5ab58e6-0111-4e00-84d0-40ac9e7f946a [Thermothielavioides terrestris]